MYYGTPPIVTNGLVFALDAANPMSYPSGSTTWRSIPSSSYNATFAPNPTPSSRYGGGITVTSGSNNFARIIGTYPTASFTFEYVFTIDKFPGNNEYNYFFSFNGNYQNSGFYAEVGPNGSYMSTININAPGLSFGYGLPLTETVTGSVYFITVSYTSGSNLVKSYKNGVLRNFGTSSFAPVLITGSYLAYLGNNTSNQTYHSIKLYNRALSDNEVLQNYNATKARFNLT